MRILKIAIGALVVIMVMAVCVSLGSPTPKAAAPVIVSTATGQAQKPAAPAKATDVPASEPTAAVTIGRMGETIAQGGYRLTVTKVEEAQAFGDFARAEAGKKLVAVEMLIESGADEGVDINPMFYAKVKDADGYEYSASLAGKEPTLKAQNNLPKGEKVRGWVTFEVPETASGLVLSYKPMTLGDAINLRVSLDQP